jgi:orotate phosphoribosyltransferase
MNHVDLKCANWIKPLVDPAKRRTVLKRTRVRIADLGAFDAIAFTGLSGSIIAGAVALSMDKYLYCVRKSNESRHSDHVVEGPATGLRYVILDDFISTGATIERIIEMVSAHTEGKAECVGAYLWRDDELRTDLLRYTSKLPRHKPAEKPVDPIDF